MISRLDGANIQQHRRRHNQLAAAGVTLALLAAIIVVRIAASPSWTEADILEDELNLLEGLLASSSPSSSSSSTLGPTSAPRTTRVTHLSIVSQDESAPILTWFDHVATTSGCQITGLRRADRANGRPSGGRPSRAVNSVSDKEDLAAALPSTTWLLDVQGSYHCIGKATEAMEQSHHVVDLRELTIQRAKRGKALAAQFELTLWLTERPDEGFPSGILE